MLETGGPKKRRSILRLITICFLIAVPCAVFSFFWWGSTLRWKARLVDAVGRADSVLVEPSERGLESSDPAWLPSLVVPGVDGVRELLAAIDIDFNFDHLHLMKCRCYGIVWFVFLSGQDELARVGFKHGRSLGWKDWPGDALLTEDSQAAVRRWLLARGYPHLEPILEREGR